jgi:hypothetical protein
MTIISTNFGHVVKTSAKARPFRIFRNGRAVSFATLSQAVKAMEEDLDQAHEEVQNLRNLGISC